MVVLAAGLLAGRIVDALNRAERRAFAHAWQLRQLVPDEAHAEARPAQEPAAPSC